MVERDVGLDSPDLVFAQRPTHAEDCLDAIFPPDDELGDHRVIVDGHLGSFIDPAIVPHPQPLGQPESVNLTRAGHEVILRILRIDAALNGMPCRADMALAPGEIGAIGHLDLSLDQVDAHDPFCDSVFHLKAGVHLQKVKILISIKKEFQRSDSDVADRARALNGDSADAAPHPVIQRRGGTFLNDLLVAPLDGTFTIIEVHHLTVLIGKNLDLHMTWPIEIFLDV